MHRARIRPSSTARPQPPRETGSLRQTGCPYPCSVPQLPPCVSMMLLMTVPREAIDPNCIPSSVRDEPSRSHDRDRSRTLFSSSPHFTGIGARLQIRCGRANERARKCNQHLQADTPTPTESYGIGMGNGGRNTRIRHQQRSTSTCLIHLLRIPATISHTFTLSSLLAFTGSSPRALAPLATCAPTVHSSPSFFSASSPSASTGSGSWRHQ